jgi:hypothetical protein
MLGVYGPHSWFWHKAKKQFFDQIWWFFTLKTRFWPYYSLLNMRKSQFNDELCVVWAHNQQVFCMFKWGKNKPKQQRVHVLVISLCSSLTNVPNKVECNINQAWKGFPGINILPYWVIRKLKRKWSVEKMTPSLVFSKLLTIILR